MWVAWSERSPCRTVCSLHLLPLDVDPASLASVLLLHQAEVSAAGWNSLSVPTFSPKVTTSDAIGRSMSVVGPANPGDLSKRCTNPRQSPKPRQLIHKN